MHGLESELERRTITYTLWNQSTTKMENKGWHPVTFGYANAGPQRIMEIKVFFLCFILDFKYRFRQFMEWENEKVQSFRFFLPGGRGGY